MFAKRSRAGAEGYDPEPAAADSIIGSKSGLMRDL
jgi:hypothetical protein